MKLKKFLIRLRTNRAKCGPAEQDTEPAVWNNLDIPLTLFMRLQSHPGKSRASLLMWNCSRLKSIAKYWRGCLKVQAAAEVCVEEAGLVSKIWAPDSPVFHLHWAWMGLKCFPSLELAAVNLQDVVGRCRSPSLMAQNICRASRKRAQTTKTLLLNFWDNFLI